MDNDQNARYFRVDGQLRYHWGADQEIMTIINKRDKSPETLALVTKRIELAKPGAIRLLWNKNLGREIYVPRRPEENERREIKRIDLTLKRKKIEPHIGGGYFRDFGDEIPQRTGQNEETYMDAESTTSNNSEEAVATHDPGAYPTISVQEYRDGPIEEIAVHYVRINPVVETKAKINKQQEDNVRSAELDFMLDLETLIKETSADPELIELNCCLEDNNTNMIPQRIQNGRKEVNTPLGHHHGRRSNRHTEIIEIRCTQCLTFGTPGHQQNVQRRYDILVAEYSGRHREKIENMLSLPKRR